MVDVTKGHRVMKKELFHYLLSMQIRKVGALTVLILMSSEIRSICSEAYS
jgi:hypothetical protein